MVIVPEGREEITQENVESRTRKTKPQETHTVKGWTEKEEHCKEGE